MTPYSSIISFGASTAKSKFIDALLGIDREAGYAGCAADRHPPA